MRAMRRFFEEGDKVKVTLRFRGRELAHQELGWQVLQRVKADIEPIAKVESEPRIGRPPDGDGAGAALSGQRNAGPPCADRRSTLAQEKMRRPAGR